MKQQEKNVTAHLKAVKALSFESYILIKSYRIISNMTKMIDDDKDAEERLE